MTNIYDIYQMLTESFQSKYVRMLAQDASLFTSDFRRFCEYVGLYYIAWDAITDDDITKYTVVDTQDLLKMYRALRAGKDNYWSTVARQRIDFKSNWYLFFGYKNDKLYCTFNSSNDIFYYVERGKLYRLDKTRATEEALAECDVVYIVTVDKHDTHKLRGDRASNQFGMIPSLDQDDRSAGRHTGVLGQDTGGINAYEGGAFTSYCKRAVADARDRWKKIIVENKFKRTSDTKEIDDLVEKTINIYTSFMQECMKAAANNSKISTYRLKDITDWVTGKAKSNKYNDYGWLEGGLLNVYRQYCEANIDLAHGNSYSAESTLKSRDNAAKYLKDLGPKIIDKIDSLKKEWGM